jgi:hypothetical protein
MKNGRFSFKEMAFIRSNMDSLTIDQMGLKLDRSPDSIYSWIEKNVGFSKQDKIEVEVNNELKGKPYYKELIKQFSSEELEMFEFHFKKMWSQFKEDVFHTEEMQIIDTIKLEILMNRILRGQQDVVEKISSINTQILNEKKTGDLADRDLIFNLERQAANLSASQETLSRDYKDLQSRKASMLKELKGTREQRIKSIEDSKQTFASLINLLTSKPEMRRSIGLEMEKMRIASENERARLSKQIQYEDGNYDRPLLNADSVNIEE